VPLRPAEVVRNGATSKIGSKRTNWVSCSDAVDWDDKEDVELTVECEIVRRMPPSLVEDSMRPKVCIE